MVERSPILLSHPYSVDRKYETGDTDNPQDDLENEFDL
jgi:hypothetical protein